MNKVIMVFMFSALLLFSCVGKANDSPCPGLEWGDSQIIFGRLSLSGQTLSISNMEICSDSLKELSGGIKASDWQGKYLFARGKAGSDTKGKKWFQLEQLLYLTDEGTPDWSLAESFVFTGLLEQGKDYKIALVTNWESRSRISHYILGPFSAPLDKAAGKYARVKAFLIVEPDAVNPWSKTIVVEEIQEISQSPLKP